MLNFRSFKQLKETAQIIQFPKNKIKKTEPASKPKISSSESFDKWHDKHIKQADNSSLTTVAAYNHYSNHAKSKGHEPLSMPEFNSHMSKKGYQKSKLAGRVRFIGIHI